MGDDVGQTWTVCNVELYLRTTIPGKPAAFDVVVDVEGSTTVAELAGALTSRLRVSDQIRGASVNGRALQATQSVAEAKLLHGDVLELHDQPVEQQRTSSTVRWGIKADTTGDVIGLVPGRAVVGRDPDAVIALDGPGAHYGHLVIDITRGGMCRITSGGDDVVVDGAPLAAGQSRDVTDQVDITLSGHHITLTRVAEGRAAGVDRLGQLLVPRPPVPVPEEVVKDAGKLSAPPGQRTPPKFSLITALLPATVGVLAAVVFRAPMFLIFALLGPSMATGSWWEGRRRWRDENKNALERFDTKAAELEERMHTLRDMIRQSALRRAPGITELRGRAELRSGVWFRRSDLNGFGVVRAGLGAVPSGIDVDVCDTDDLDDERAAKVENILALRSSIEAMPLEVPLCEGNTIVVSGSRAEQNAAALLLSLATSCSPDDVVLAGDVAQRFPWMKWLPHLRSPASPIDGAHLEATTSGVLHRCAQLDEDRDGPWVVAVCGDNSDSAAVAAVVAAAGEERKLTVMWVGRDPVEAPNGADLLVHVDDGGVAITTVSTGEQVRGASDIIDRDDAEACALRLAPLADATGADRAAAIPTRVELFELCGGFDPDTLTQRWAAHQPGTLRAPLGAGADGLVDLDLVADGPHVLIAGTSGSGKSELLSSWVTSLANRYPPQELTFLFIDYKGGSATEVFSTMPHTVGMVTDLDENTAMRALVSLRAEVRRRETAQSGIAADRDTWARTVPGQAPPSLVIVVDEFATMAREIPDFVDGIVDVAQRGRSLGLHLVLATQRPGGSVSESILANVGVRVCLRTVDVAESTAVIGSGDAAHIPQPLRGRAIIKHGSQLTWFQSGWATAPQPDEAATTHLVTVRHFDTPGQFASGGGGSGVAAHRTQVTAAVDAITRTAAGKEAPRRPWLDELDAVIPARSIVPRLDANVRHTMERHAVLGMIDDPGAQDQYPAVVDLDADGGLIVVGGGGSGKTTMVRTAAATAAAAVPPALLSFVVMDFSSRALSALRDLPHCVGWATGGDVESVTRTITLLEHEVAQRRRRLQEEGAASWSELGERGERLWVVLDDLGAFRSEFENLDYGTWVERLRRVVAEGRQVGIHLLATADRRASIPAGVGAAVSSRVVLRCTEPDEYIIWGLPGSVAEIELPAGRGWLNTAVVHGAVLDRDTTTKGAAALISQIAARAGKRSRPAWEPLPDRVDASALAEAQNGRVPVGVADLGAGVVTVAADNHLLVAGPPGSGRTSVLALLAGQMPHQHVVASGEDLCARLGNDATKASDVSEIVAAATPGSLVLIDDAERWADDPLAGGLETLLSAPGVTVVAAMDPAAAARSWTGWVPALRRSRQLWWLWPEGNVDLGVRVALRPGVEMTPGRSMLWTHGTSVLFQAATTQQLDSGWSPLLGPT